MRRSATRWPWRASHRNAKAACRDSMPHMAQLRPPKRTLFMPLRRLTLIAALVLIEDDIRAKTPGA